MTTSNAAHSVEDNDFLHLLRSFVLYLVLSVLVLVFGLGLLVYAAILRSTGGRARDLFLLFIPLVNFYVGHRALWRYTAKNHYWEDRTDLNPHPVFGPGHTFADRQSSTNQSPSTATSKVIQTPTSDTQSKLGLQKDNEESASGRSPFSANKLKPEPANPVVDEDPEVRALREQLAAAEQAAEERRKEEELDRQKADKAQRVEELTRELAEAEAKLEELKNSSDSA
jgi:hypothetical protein